MTSQLRVYGKENNASFTFNNFISYLCGCVAIDDGVPGDLQPVLAQLHRKRLVARVEHGPDPLPALPLHVLLLPLLHEGLAVAVEQLLVLAGERGEDVDLGQGLRAPAHGDAEEVRPDADGVEGGEHDDLAADGERGEHGGDVAVGAVEGQGVEEGALGVQVPAGGDDVHLRVELRVREGDRFRGFR